MWSSSWFCDRVSPFGCCGVHRHEHYRVAVDRDLESLQFAMSQIVRRRRNEPVNERVWIPSIIHNRSAADILDDQDVAPVIRMNSFITATAEAAIERAQTRAAAGVCIKIGAHLDDPADSTVFLGKEQCSTKRIPGGTIDAVESSQKIRVTWCHKCDAMIRDAPHQD